MRIGIDLGGTKIEVAVLDKFGEEIFRERAPTPTGDYEGTLKTIADLVQTAEITVNARGATVGIAIPGAVSPKTGLIKNSNSLCLIGHPLDKDLSKLLNRTVRLANDANCFALSEATDGAGKNCEVVFGAILGTGVGSGIVVRGTVVSGRNLIAGEWGHNPLPWMREDEYPGPTCYCGRKGCIEMFLSGPALEREYGKVSGKKKTAEEISELLGQGDGVAEQLIEIYEDRLARALISIINILDPDAIVLGGGVSNIDRLYRNVPKAWEKYMFSDVLDTVLLKAKFGDSSGVRGAAWLWPESASSAENSDAAGPRGAAR